MYDFILSFPQSFAYIASAPYFWLSMGMTIGVAMFVGAIIYDGELEYAWKGLLSISMYGFFLFQVIFTRVTYNYAAITTALTPGQAFANLTTVLIVTLFWMMGVMIGVFVSSKYHTHHIK